MHDSCYFLFLFSTFYSYFKIKALNNKHEIFCSNFIPWTSKFLNNCKYDLLN